MIGTRLTVQELWEKWAEVLNHKPTKNKFKKRKINTVEIIEAHETWVQTDDD